jgi:hypothetical protein
MKEFGAFLDVALCANGGDARDGNAVVIRRGCICDALENHVLPLDTASLVWEADNRALFTHPILAQNDVVIVA